MDYKRWQMLKNNLVSLNTKEKLELINFEKTNRKQFAEFMQKQESDDRKKQEIMSIKDRETRRKKIAQNLDLFEFQKR